VTHGQREIRLRHVHRLDPDASVEVIPNKRLVLTWAEPAAAADAAGHSRVAIDIEVVGEMVRLTVTHDELQPEMAKKIAAGWPRVLSSLKSLLETGRALDTWA
jgi:uncharacterized protein YndB with AHSA1/START domain